MPTAEELSRLKRAIEEALGGIGDVQLSVDTNARVIVLTWRDYGLCYKLATPIGYLNLYSFEEIARQAYVVLTQKVANAIFPQQSNAELAC